MVYERGAPHDRGHFAYCTEVAALNVDKISPGPELDTLVAEQVFGWKNVHRHQDALYGKKQDKLGRWRSAKVPNFSTNSTHAYAIEERMKQLGLLERYNKDLSKARVLRLLKTLIH